MLKWLVFVAMLISLLSGKFIINKLKKLKIDQQILEIGPSWHLTKQGTPTMGGLIFIIGFIIASIPICFVIPKFIIVIITTIGFGLVGFIDDFAKIRKKENEGLTPKQKIIFQVIIVFILMLYLVISGEGYYMYIPFIIGKVHIGVLFIPLLFIVVLGTVNGVNLTDGIDGLAGSVTFIVCIILTGYAYMRQDYNLGYGISCLCGGLIGFLFYNLFPAQVFMGDTGSLALGGFIASVAYLLQAPFYIVIFGIVYFIECLSVMLQVWYAKTHNGKRIFKMAPIHHHFEKCGWSENKIVLVFSIITVVMGTISLIIYARGI